MPQILKVGGCVRDAILGVKTKDIDFTFVLDSLDKTVAEGFQEMKSWMEERKYEIFLVTEDKFTIRGKFPKDHQYAGLVADFVMARKETGYVEGTRSPILVLGTLEDDLMRRDFTANSLAEDENGNIIDLFNGIQAIKDKILKTPLDPNITLLDDPLRLLRAYRFCITKGFTIHDSIIEASKNPEIIEKLKTVVSIERIREELFKMFNHDTVKTIKLLHEMNIHIPQLYEIIFQDRLWLKPTLKE